MMLQLMTIDECIYEKEDGFCIVINDGVVEAITEDY